jgi:hypothetical protein
MKELLLFRIRYTFASVLDRIDSNIRFGCKVSSLNLAQNHGTYSKIQFDVLNEPSRAIGLLKNIAGTNIVWQNRLWALASSTATHRYKA